MFTYYLFFFVVYGETHVAHPWNTIMCKNSNYPKHINVATPIFLKRKICNKKLIAATGLPGFFPMNPIPSINKNINSNFIQQKH